MSNPAYDTGPEPSEVLQEEPTESTRIDPVPVTVEGPVRIQQLPSPIWAAQTVTLVADQPQQILAAEPRRKRAIIQVTTATVHFAPTREQALTEHGAFRVAASTNAFFEITHCGEVWANTNTGSPEVAMLQEFWTE